MAKKQAKRSCSRWKSCTPPPKPKGNSCPGNRKFVSGHDRYTLVCRAGAYKNKNKPWLGCDPKKKNTKQGRYIMHLKKIRGYCR